MALTAVLSCVSYIGLSVTLSRSDSRHPPAEMEGGMRKKQDEEQRLNRALRGHPGPPLPDG